LAIGLKLIISDSRTNTTDTRVFGHFPVRIGRNPLNDLKLLPGFVSQFHAVLELHGDVLMLRDLGSKNGTLLLGGRAPAHEPVDLSTHQWQFAIAALSFTVSMEDVGDVAPVRAPQRGLLLGGLGVERAQMAETMLVDTSQPMGLALEPQVPAVVPEIPRSLSDGTATLKPLKGQYASSRATIARVLQTLAADLTPLSPEHRQELFKWMRDEFPNIAEEAEFKRLLEHHGMRIETADTTARGRRLEYVALQAVRELSSLYRPKMSPIDDEQSLVQFLTRVRDTLDMFFKTFVPLRDGYRQFKSDLDIRDATPYFNTPAGRMVMAVARAKSAQALAELLLGGADDQVAALKAVEGTFADLMIHQLALLSGVMRGVHALMGELAPGTVDGALEEQKRKGTTGWTFGPYRFRELWRVYTARHADLADGEKQLFSLVFGNDFVRAYAQLSGEGSAQATSPDLSAESQ
jgi:type VI secretion system protein ImpI